MGTLVDKHSHTVAGVSYLDFIAPGLLAATAMQIGANEAMYPVMGAIKWMRTYFAMLATPLAGRSTCSSGTWAGWWCGCSRCRRIYLVVIAAFGVVRTPLAVLAIPAAVLTGMAFAAPMAAFAATPGQGRGLHHDLPVRADPAVPVLRHVLSGDPAARLAPAGRVRPPLYHGVYLCRGLVLGTLTLLPSLGSAAYLVALSGLGFWLAFIAYRNRLIV